jgi:hypothetical protein
MLGWRAMYECKSCRASYQVSVSWVSPRKSAECAWLAARPFELTVIAPGIRLGARPYEQCPARVDVAM